MVHKISLACALVCFVLALSGVEAHGQIPAPRSYLFVDVKDTSGQPVTDASVAVYGADGKQITSGVANEGKFRFNFPIRTDRHYSVLVSRQGFQPSEHVFFAKPFSLGKTLVEKMSIDYDINYSSIVLQKPPATAAERKAFDAQELRAQMILAAKRGDPLRVSKLLQLGVDADAVDVDGVSALVWAAFTGDVDTINALLERGARVRTKNPLGSKALLIYLAEGLIREQQGRTSDPDDLYKRATTVSNLIKAGADVNAKDPYLRTTLTAALRAVPTSLPVTAVADLLKAGANVSTPDEGLLSTPLMWASVSGSLESVKMLLAAGASIDVKDKQGRTALMWAQVVRRFPEHYDPELVNTLIKAGANVNVSDENGVTPLILAAQLDRPESIKMLLAAGAKVNAKDKWGNTALIAAFDSYYSQNDKDSIHHPTPLTIRTLLEAGADIHAVSEAKPPILMLAARTDSLEALKMLLEAGADISVRDQKGKTALMYDKLWGYAPSVEAFKILIAAKGDLNAVGPAGRTPLMFAAYGAPPEIIDLLLERGAKASINAIDHSGQTALMHAAYYSGFSSTPEDRVRTVKALLDAGADVSIKDSSGQTALAIAQAYNRNQAVIELLKSKQPN